MHNLNGLFGALKAPLPISNLLNREQYLQLAHHLANGRNGKGCFLGSMGEPVYGDLRRPTLTQAIESTWRSVVQYEPFASSPFALAVYDRSENGGLSSWAAFDLDWHEAIGPSSRVKSNMGKLWQATIGLWKAGHVDALILELSGRGLHLWMIAAQPRPLQAWRDLVRDVLDLAGCAITGIDLFPSKGTRGSKGKALRLPGSVNVMRFNPRDGAPMSTIIAAPGLRDLSQNLAAVTSSKDKPVYIGMRSPPSRAKKQEEIEMHLLQKHRIDQPRCRHNKTRAMVNEAFFKLPDRRILELSDLLFTQASPPATTSLEDHQVEAKDLLRTWKLLIRDCLFTPEERTVLATLADPKEEKAFHCIHNFHRLAIVQGKADFAISSEALGRAIGFSHKTAIEVIRMFVSKGFIVQTLPAVVGKYCARYRWLLPSLSAREISGQWESCCGTIPV